MTRDTPLALLLIDDEPAQTRLIGAIASRVGWRMHAVTDAEGARALLAAEKIDAVLIDAWVPGSDDGASVAAIRASHPDMPVLILTAQNAVDVAIAAMRAGANDFLVKPITAERLVAALDAVSTHDGDGDGELRPLSEKIRQPLGFEQVVGSAPEFRAALAIAAKAARARVPVLIEGEPGVGKEVIARAVHAASSRGRRQMLTVNCGAIAPNLIESELFGHERGAFPGAFERRIGRLIAADGGTLFLDEVDALPPDTQLRLLNTILTGEVRPIGGRHAQIVDVRIIAASDRPLDDAIATGQMREDLYYRLAVVQLTIPPLRDRAADIPALARHLLARIATQPGMRRLGISDEALSLLMGYDWPGNVRQLQNALFRAAVLCDGEMLSANDFPQIAQAARSPGSRSGMAMTGPLAAESGVTLFEPNGHLRSLEAIEADVIRLAIGHYRGRMTEVARRLGIGRSTLYRRLGELGIGDAA